MAMDLNLLNNQLQSFSSNATKPTTGKIISTWLSSNLGNTFGKMGSTISKGLSSAATPISSITGGISGISNFASALGSDDKTIKTIGMADSGVQVAGAALDMIAPGLGTGLNMVNSLGGKLIGTPKEVKDFSVNQGLGSGFGQVSSTAASTKGATSAYGQAGLAGKLFAGSGMKRRVGESNASQSNAQGMVNQANKLSDASKNSLGMFDINSQNRINRTLYNNPNTQITMGKNGMVLKQLPKFSSGGRLKNIIVNGALHARRSGIKDLDEFKDADITEKGVIVISKDANGAIIQHAEVETGEIIFTKEITDKLNKLFEKNDEQAQIEAGKLLSYEIMKNTIDNKEKIIKNA